MTIARCSRPPASCHVSPCCSLPSIGHIVIVLAVFILAVVLALRSYSSGAITSLMMVLVLLAVAAADRLIDVQRVRPVSALPTP